MKYSLISATFAALFIYGNINAGAAEKNDSLSITSFKASPIETVREPHYLDSLDNNGKPFDPETILSSPIASSLSEGSAKQSRNTVSTKSKAWRIRAIEFFAENRSFTKASVKLVGADFLDLEVDGISKKLNNGNAELKLEPATHRFVVKMMESTDSASAFSHFKAELIAPEGKVRLRTDGKRIFSLDHNTQGTLNCYSSISPTGKYLVTGRQNVTSEGKNSWLTQITDRKSGKILASDSHIINWLSKSDCYTVERPAANPFSDKGKDLWSINVGTGEEKILFKDIPDEFYILSPTDDFAIVIAEDEGPKEGAVHQVLSPEDRQPGWRDRTRLEKLDFKTGLRQPLTFGWTDCSLLDISADGKWMLFSTSHTDYTIRPTRRYSYHRMNLETLEVQTIIRDDGFITDASFSPDGGRIAVTASPESFGGIGSRVKPDQTPNAYDIHLYTVDIATGKVTALTADDKTSVENMEWSIADGKIYYTASEKDMVHLYRTDPESGKTEMLTDVEDNIKGFSLTRTVPGKKTAAEVSFYGQSLNNAYRIWTLALDGKSKPVLVCDTGKEQLNDVILGEGGEYEFTSSRGDRINCFYELPPDFDPNAIYPMIVHYYGGCNPSSRYLIGSYSPAWYAAQGYVFLVVNPSGASGFGQEFAARHVNTAGDVVADDIIEAVQNFCKDHNYVNTKKIGCFSASYGGFMTQLLLTKTDMFATGISHAGISDHTSYWGEGYWGYSYSQVCMANSFPWNRKDLYVDRSPLYNADKIHTPLLFLHGSADTNVPIGESIQMFTALKTLGQDTAFVIVDGENHGIREYGKRRQWLRTISAWFARYLKDDSSWWDELYPDKTLK